MNKVIYLTILLMVGGCTNTKKISQKRESQFFAYVLPLPVEEEVWRLVKTKNLENNNLFFQLRRGNDFYHLLVTPTKNITNEYLGFFKVSNSNRNILINDKLYPIVFDSDYDFGSLLEKVEPLENRKQEYLSNEYNIQRGSYTISEITFGVKFTKSGEILK
jgi:hypothetical protein